MPRTADIARKTKETDIRIRLTLEGTGASRVQTGIGFFDHMLETFARHGRLDLDVEAKGDLHVDDHHTVEDVGLALGQALKTALGDKRGITRFGWAFCPMDDALARAVVDLSGRPRFECELPVAFHPIGQFGAEAILEFFQAFANAGALTLHLDLIRGGNLHHAIEALFKASALALRTAAAVDSGLDDVPSTKGTL
jgi:imidazoleglycerol-phosphate dehydratase